jgi:4-hydroxy-tetrahydrodipicolinate synthase
MSEFKHRIIGPVIPLPIPFRENGDLDLDALSRYVEFLVSEGIKNIMTTVGTSRFNLLTPGEVKEANACVVKAAAGKAITIVANPPFGATAHAIDFARHSEEIGADYYLVYYPERFYGDDNTFGFYKSVQDSLSKTKILLHEMPSRNGYGPGTVQFSLELLKKLLSLPNISGLKEEALDNEYSNKIVETFHASSEMIGAGGGMSRYLLRDFDRGAKAYLGGIGNFVPSLELEFFEAIQNGNKEKAEKIVKEIELPYFEKVVPLGWHPSLKAALAIKGLMPAYEREPMIKLNDSQRELIRSVMKSNNWI